MALDSEGPPLKTDITTETVGGFDRFVRADIFTVGPKT